MVKVETFQKLQKAREAFRTYRDAIGLPVDRATAFLDEAMSIPDRLDRERYRELAIAMLQANIDHYRADATELPLPQRAPYEIFGALGGAIAASSYSTTATLAGALVGSVLGYYTSRRRYADDMATVREHNAGVPEWAVELREWSKELDTLELDR